MKTIKLNKPGIHEIFHDSNNRVLKIDKINIGSNDGREIIGRITNVKEYEWKQYSCTIDIWEKIWRDKIPAADPAEMKI